MKVQGTMHRYRFQAFFGVNAFNEVDYAIGDLTSRIRASGLTKAESGQERYWKNCWRCVRGRASDFFKDDPDSVIVLLELAVELGKVQKEVMSWHNVDPWCSLYVVSYKYITNHANAYLLGTDFEGGPNSWETPLFRTLGASQIDLDCLIALKPLSFVSRAKFNIGGHRAEPPTQVKRDVPTAAPRWVTPNRPYPTSRT